MNSILIILIVVPAISAFSNESFHYKCRELEFHEAEEIHEIYVPVNNSKCLICENITLTSLDAETFANQEINISDKYCFLFYGGNLGNVNGDFFKQFPKAINMVFRNLSMDLKASKKIKPHRNINYLEISNCKITGNSRTNAFHSLVNLITISINYCSFEKTTIDSELLKKNFKLKEIEILGENKSKLQNSIKSIEGNALENLQKLKSFYFQSKHMKKLPKQIFRSNPKLNNIALGMPLEKIPENIPSSVEFLEIYNSKIRKISRSDLSRFKNLCEFGLFQSDLEFIEEDSFDDLTLLESLDLSNNKLKTFSNRILENNKVLELLNLKENLIADWDLGNLPLIERADDPGFYEGK